jgi:hypothetical protein
MDDRTLSWKVRPWKAVLVFAGFGGAIAPELDGQRSWTIAQETVSMTA